MSNVYESPTYSINKQETVLRLNDNSFKTTWITEHNEKFSTPKVENQRTGKIVKTN